MNSNGSSNWNKIPVGSQFKLTPHDPMTWIKTSASMGRQVDGGIVKSFNSTQTVHPCDCPTTASTIKSSML